MRLPATGDSTKRGPRAGRGVLLTALVLVTLAQAARGQTKTWSGIQSALWSDPGNWVEGAAPVDGDSLHFPYYTFSHNMWNDIPGLTVGSVTSEVDFRVNGETVTLTGNLDFQQWNVPTILGADVAMKADVMGGVIELAGHSLALHGTLWGSIQGAGSVTVSGSLTLADASVSAFAGTFTVASATNLAVYGTISVSTLVVQPGGSLGGNGTVGATMLTGANLFAGEPFTTGPLVAQGGRMPFEIRRSPTINGQSQLRVLGAVSLASPSLELNLPWNPPLPGEQIILVDNDGSDPIVGTFAGRPEGAVFSSGDASFRISYAGGDGNDIVITAEPWTGPKRWIGVASALWSDPANWLHGVPPVDGDSLHFPYYGSFSHNMWNDIPGLTLSSVTSFADFQVGGETLTLAGPASFQRWNVPTILGGPSTIQADVGSVIELGGHALILDGNLGGSIQGAGSVTVSSGLSVSGTSNFAGPFTVSPNASLNVYGTILGSPVAVNGGVLFGSGSVPATTVTDGTLSGQVLTTGDLRVVRGSIFFPDNNFRIRVLGTVTLASPMLGSLSQNPPTPGQEFVLIDNDGAEAVSGTFAGLPEGAVVPGYPFRITYVGGTGNDVAIVGLVSTTTTLQSSRNPAGAFEAITLTANVASSSGQPGGSVVFEEWLFPGTRILGSALLDANGNAALSIQLAPGRHYVVARFSGGGEFGSSLSETLEQVVNGAPNGAATIPTLGGTALILLAIGLGAVGARLAFR
jgi:hypothetical protein